MGIALSFLCFKSMEERKLLLSNFQKLVFLFLVIFSSLMLEPRVAMGLPIIFTISLVDGVQGYIYDEDILILAILFFRLEHTPGAIIFFAMVYLLARISKGLGMGDVLYFTTLSFFGGFLYGVIIFFSSCIIASIFCIPKIFKDDRSLSFAPFISMAFLITRCI